MKYLIIAREEIKPKIQLETFIALLERRWTITRYRNIEVTKSAYAIEWEFCVDKQTIEGMLSKDKLTIVLDGNLISCARFAIWWRSRVYEECPLILCDEFYYEDIELLAETTEQEVVSKFIDVSGETKV